MSLFTKLIQCSWRSLSLITISMVSISLLEGLEKTFPSSDWGPFQDSGAIIDNGDFEIPSSAEAWAGYWNSNSTSLPLSFPNGGELTFTASVPGGGSANVYFKFEKNSYPDTEPSYTTTQVTVSGNTNTQYSVTIPSQGSNTFSSFLFYIVDRDTPVTLGTTVVTENEAVNIYSNYYTPSNVNNYSGNFYFGQNTDTGSSIQWRQEINYNPFNEEIQDYVDGKVGLDDNDYLVLRIDRTGSNTYYSSRINTDIYNGIKVGSGEKLTVEFEAQLPMAKDTNGNYVADVPLWPALWLMGNDQINNQWVGWPFCAEIDVMEWSPTIGETQANIAYHWNAGESTPYSHYYVAEYYTDPEIHTKFHKWRVDVYRYDDGVNTNKIEIYRNDVLISGSTFEQSSGLLNQEYWYPTTGFFPQTFGSGDKEYFLIMNIALGGTYPQTSTVPSNFDHAEMVVKSVNYQVSSLARFTLDLSYNTNHITLTKTPDQADYLANSSVLVEATPNLGYVLGNTDWTSYSVLMDEDKTFSITSYPDFNDNDADGVTNYAEAIVYNSDLNDPDSDNDNTSDYFESIAGTSLIDPTDYFYMIGSMDNSGLYSLEYNSVSSRTYSLKVSDDLVNWHEWKSQNGDGNIHFDQFNPTNEAISGLDMNSTNFFFKIDIEEQQNTTFPPPPSFP